MRKKLIYALVDLCREAENQLQSKDPVLKNIVLEVIDNIGFSEKEQVYFTNLCEAEGL